MKTKTQYLVNLLSHEFRLPSAEIWKDKPLIKLKSLQANLKNYINDHKTDKNMKANAKELLKNVTDSLHQLKFGEIKIAKAQTVAYLTKQGLGLLEYEVKKAIAMADPAIKAEFTDIEDKDL